MFVYVISTGTLALAQRGRETQTVLDRHAGIIRRRDQKSGRRSSHPFVV
jgi:hypothetical protein